MKNEKQPTKRIRSLKAPNKKIEETFALIDVSGASDMDTPEMSKLMELFSHAQLNLIECAFEMAVRFNKDKNDSETVDRAVKLGVKYTYNDDKRLMAICKNIIENHGEFRP